VVKFYFAHSKLSKQAFCAENLIEKCQISKSRDRGPYLPPSDDHATTTACTISRNQYELNQGIIIECKRTTASALQCAFKSYLVIQVHYTTATIGSAPTCERAFFAPLPRYATNKITVTPSAGFRCVEAVCAKPCGGPLFQMNIS